MPGNLIMERNSSQQRTAGAIALAKQARERARLRRSFFVQLERSRLLHALETIMKRGKSPTLRATLYSYLGYCCLQPVHQYIHKQMPAREAGAPAVQDASQINLLGPHVRFTLSLYNRGSDSAYETPISKTPAGVSPSTRPARRSRPANELFRRITRL